jgi:hypothetical protein
MNKEKLALLVARYRQHKEDHIFSEIYEEVSKRWTGKLEFEAHFNKVDMLDLQEKYDEVVMRAVNDERISPENFRNYVGVMLKSKKLNLIRDTKRRNRRYLLQKGGNPDEEEAMDYLDTMNYLEGNLGKDSFEEVAENKKETEQRQLLDFLVDPAKVKDRTTTAIVRTALNDTSISKKLKAKAIAEQLGLPRRDVVTRKLSSLKKNYDESLFGDYRDYLHA